MPSARSVARGRADVYCSTGGTVGSRGDLAGLGEGTVEVQPGADPESDVLGQLLKLGEQVVKEDVVVFACQKVIHPVLQHYLRRHGVDGCVVVI